jgi:hypothetical protein
MVTFIVIAVYGPIKIGIYKDDLLIDSRCNSGKTSEALPSFFYSLFEKYNPQKIVYANGPGSFTSIKLSYIFLKSIAIVKNIELFSVDSFYFCNNKPIKAIANSCFIKENDKIIIQKIEKPFVETELRLPNNISFSDFSNKTKPLYMLPCV